MWARFGCSSYILERWDEVEVSVYSAPFAELQSTTFERKMLADFQTSLPSDRQTYETIAGCTISSRLSSSPYTTWSYLSFEQAQSSGYRTIVTRLSMLANLPINMLDTPTMSKSHLRKTRLRIDETGPLPSLNYRSFRSNATSRVREYFDT
jgi:hypothetical protein